MKLDPISYVPVLNGSILNCALRDDLNIDGKRITFYTKDGLFKYDKYLINPFHHAKIFEDIKRKQLLLESGAIFADSVTRNETILVRDKEGNINNIFIGEFVDSFLNKKKKISINGHDYDDIEGYEVLTIDDDYKQCFKPIKRVIRHKVEKDIYRVSTTSGLMIEVTADHSLINLDKNLRFIGITIKDMKKRKDRLIGIKEINIFKNEYLNKITGNNYTLKLDKELLRFFGLWIGDGSFNKKLNCIGLSGVHKKEILDLFNRIGGRFDYIPKFNGRYDAVINNKKMIVFMLELGFDGHSHTKRVPSWIFNLSKEQIGCFLSGYFEADGTVKEKGLCTGICTVSKGLFSDISVLLKILGIGYNVRYEKGGICTFRQSDKIYKKKPEYILMIYGKQNLELFAKYVGFITKEKKERMNNIVKLLKDVKSKDYYNNIPLRLVPNNIIKSCGVWGQKAISLKRLKKNGNDILKGADIGFYQIKTIEKINYNDYVYDLSIDKLERFLCSNVLVKNSGGLQEITLNEVRYTPAEVFKWQQENTHIGFSVDSLPFITNINGSTTPGSFTGWKFDKANFDKHAEKSRDNIQVTKKHRNSNDFKFYGIIQGRRYEEYLRWFEIIKDEAYLDGYCCKAPNVNPMSLAQTTIFVMNNINKPVHFLGIGNISRAIVLYYAKKYIKQPLSYDSSSYDVGTQYRSYLLPFMFNKKVRLVNPKNLEEDKDDICGLQDVVHLQDASKICDCIACKSMPNTMEMINKNDPKLGSLISVHNLILNIKINNYVQEIINKPEKLREFVEFNFEKHLATKIMNAFDMIDTAHERGVDYALQKYKDEEQVNRDTGNQKGVFDF